jgi:hypothetical protein
MCAAHAFLPGKFMGLEYTEFFSGLDCRFFALGPFLPENGIEITLPITPRNLPAGTTEIKVVNAARKHVGGWTIDISERDLDSELQLPLSALRR